MVIRLHDSGQNWGTPSSITGLVSDDNGATTAHSETIDTTSSTGAYNNEAVSHELGKMVYQNPYAGTQPSDYVFPSLRQMRAMKKQAIILSDFPSAWAFKGSDGEGLLSIQYRYDQFTSQLCTFGTSSSLTYLHTPGTFAETGEDRTLSNPYQGRMFDAPRVKQALACGFDEIGLDFLGTLDEAPDPAALIGASPLLAFMQFLGLPLPFGNFQCDDFSQGNSCSTTDTRRETMIWSWQPPSAGLPNQGAPNTPVQMTTAFGDPFGSWLSVNENSTAPYLCAGPVSGTTFPDGTYPDQKAWLVTKTTGPWAGGEDACQAVGPAWHFWHPGSAVQNILAWNALRASGFAAAAWINYYQGPVLALPETLAFTTPQGVVPPSRTIVAAGGLGGALTVTPSDPHVSVSSVPLFDNPDPLQTSDNNDSGMYTVGISQAGANLPPGNYTFKVNVAENTTITMVTPAGPPQTTQCCNAFPLTVNLTVQSPLTTIKTEPEGLVVLVDGAPYATPQSFGWGAGSTHTVDASQPTVNTNTTLATFVKWTDGGAVMHTITAPATAPLNLTAQYKVSYFLAINTVGHGTVTVNANGGPGFYPRNSAVFLTATPQPGSYFVGFSGDLTGVHNPGSLNMNSAHAVTATFGDYAVVTVGAAPSGINVTADNIGHATPATFQWIPNSTHTLSFPATVSLGTGKRLLFLGWSDGNTQNPRTVTAVNGETFTPVYVTQDLVTTAANPAGGGQITAGGWETDGSKFTFTATANGGYAFAGFTGSVTSPVSPLTVTLIGPLTVAANFAPAAPRITVTAQTINDSNPSSAGLSLNLTNSGLGAASLVTLTVSATTLMGSGTVADSLPIPIVTSLQPGASASVPVTLNWPSTANRIKLSVTITANSGAYQGTQALYIFR